MAQFPNTDTLISELTAYDAEHGTYLQGILRGVGMSCTGCHLALNETIGEACRVHDMDADILIDALRTYLANAQ